MKKIFLLLIVLFLFCGCSSKSQPKEDKIYEEEKVEKDLSNVESACKYIDAVLLKDDKKEAYDSLVVAVNNANTIEELNKLKEYTKYLPIREVKAEYYNNDDEYTDIKHYRYDENGRLIKKGDDVYFYPDDGGDVYYYILSSMGYTKRCYDKEDHLLAIYEWYEYSDKDFKPYNDKYSFATLYNYNFDNNGNIIKEICTRQSGNKVFNKSITENTYDSNGNLIKTKTTYEYDDGTQSSYYTEYGYDEHNNLVHEKSNGGFGGDYESSYINEYDDMSNLVKKTFNSETYDYTYETKYVYDKLYDVVLTEKDEYSYIKHTYEFALADGKATGLLGKNDIAIVSGDAVKAVTQRKILATNIKVRKTPTTHEENKVDVLPKDTIVDVYDSVHAENYAWYEIGENRWIADDGTWTEEVPVAKN